MHRWYPYRWLRVRGWMLLRRFLQLRATPHAIALGTAIGVFIGMTPTVGLQMVIAFLIASVLGGNRLAAILPAWITNPVTIVPIFTFNYWLGVSLVGGPGVDDFRRQFAGIMRAYEASGFGAATRLLLDLGLEVLVPLWIGSVLVGLAAASATYPLMRRAVVGFRRRRDRKRADRQTRVDIRLREVSDAADAMQGEEERPTGEDASAENGESIPPEGDSSAPGRAGGSDSAPSRLRRGRVAHAERRA